MPIKVNEEQTTTKKVTKKVSKPKVVEAPVEEVAQIPEVPQVAEVPKKVTKKTMKKTAPKVEAVLDEVVEAPKKKTVKKTTKKEEVAPKKVEQEVGTRLDRVSEENVERVYFPEHLVLDEEYVPVESPNRELLARILQEEKGYPIRVCLKEGLESPDDTNVPYTMLVGLYACDTHLLTIDITSKLKDKNSTIRLTYEELRDGMQDGLPFRTYIRKSALK